MPDMQQQMRVNAAQAALEYIGEDQIIGIGSGKTIKIFIEQLATIKNKIAGTVASSVDTAKALKSFSIPVLDFNSVNELPIYIDSCDAFNDLKQLIKGGCGYLTQEKILAYAAKQFVCIVDANKKSRPFSTAPIPVEVIPMARSSVARSLVKLGGRPEYRANYTTDNGNIILDVHGLELTQPMEYEQKFKQIPGVVESGIFAVRTADVMLIGTAENVTKL